jgi:hypothetical protein
MADEAEVRAIANDLHKVVAYGVTEGKIRTCRDLFGLVGVPADMRREKASETLYKKLDEAKARIHGEYELRGFGAPLPADKVKRALHELLWRIKDLYEPERRQRAREILGVDTFIGPDQWRKPPGLFEQKFMMILARELLQLAVEQTNSPQAKVRVDYQETTLEIKDFSQRVRSETVLGLTALVDDPGFLFFTETLGGLDAVRSIGLTYFSYQPRTPLEDGPPFDDTATVVGKLPSLKANESCTVAWTTTRFWRRTPERVHRAYGDVDVVAAYDMPLLTLRLRLNDPSERFGFPNLKSPTVASSYEGHDFAPGSGIGVVQHGSVESSADGTTFTCQFRNVRKLHHYGISWLY